MTENNGQNPEIPQKGGSGIERRDLLKGLATLPLLGVFGLSAWGKSNHDKKRKNNILSELNVEATPPPPYRSHGWSFHQNRYHWIRYTGRTTDAGRWLCDR